MASTKTKATVQKATAPKPAVLKPVAQKASPNGGTPAPAETSESHPGNPGSPRCRCSTSPTPPSRS